MKNLKLWIKLGIGFGVVLCIMCGLGIQAIMQMEAQRQASAFVADARMAEVDIAVRFERAAQLTMQNMLRFINSGDTAYYDVARKQMQVLEGTAKEASDLLAKYPGLTRLATNLKAAQGNFAAYQPLAEKTRELVEKLNMRRSRLHASAADFFAILEETLTLAEKALEVVIRESRPHDEILSRANSVYLMNEAMDLGNMLESANSKAQSAGDPEMAAKALPMFAKLSAVFEQLNANALPHNRERVKKVAEVTEAYRVEMAGMIQEWRELKVMSVERGRLIVALQTNAQDTSIGGIRGVQEMSQMVVKNSAAAIKELWIGLGIAVVLGFLFAWRLTRMISKPLDKSVNFAVSVSEGDLNQHLDIDSKDEIGRLSKALNTMVQTLVTRIREADEATQEANVRKEEATVAMQKAEEARAMAEQAKRQGMWDAAGQLEGIVSTVSMAAEQLSTQVEQASRGAQQQATRVGDTAASMDEMNASVLDVARSTGATAEVSNQARMKAIVGAEAVNKVVAGMERINTGAVELRQDMEQLSAKAESIGSILNVISDIADQTNLLALNAAIEAARAGEAGRGFAVVADEVRKLAENTMQATREVGDAIRGIQDGTTMNMAKVEDTVNIVNEVTVLATDSGDALAEIVTLVDQASEQIRGIAAASEQQSATCESINRSVSEVNHIASETASTMADSGVAVNELNTQSTVLSNLIRDMKNS